MPNQQNFDKLVEIVNAEENVVDSALQLIAGLANEVRGLEPNQQAIDDLAAKLEGQRDRLAAAVAANTPAQG